MDMRGIPTALELWSRLTQTWLILKQSKIMCGRFNLLPNGQTEALLQKLKVKGEPRYARDIAPGSSISIIHGLPDTRMNEAVWWLLLDHQSLKPNYRYPSFNSNHAKLNKSGSLAYKPFRESRCIIPASAFVEGLGDGKTYHKIELEQSAIAFGGLYREHLNRETGEVLYSASIITLPPVEKWRNIHPKSIPLMLDPDDGNLIQRWLDPDFREVSAFEPLLEAGIQHPQRITPIDRPGKWNPIADSFRIT